MKKYLIISLLFISRFAFSIPGFGGDAPEATPQSGGGVPSIPMEEGIIPFLIMGGILAYKIIKKK